MPVAAFSPTAPNRCGCLGGIEAQASAGAVAETHAPELGGMGVDEIAPYPELPGERGSIDHPAGASAPLLAQQFDDPERDGLDAGGV